jgi:hypothetical protein
MRHLFLALIAIASLVLLMAWLVQAKPSESQEKRVVTDDDRPPPPRNGERPGRAIEKSLPVTGIVASFHIDLGDTFMTEKHENRDAASKQYLAQRYYFGQLCQTAPLFLVLGNHDGESHRGRGSDADCLAVWSNLMRKRYFPNPVPDNFYTDNTIKHP